MKKILNIITILFLILISSCNNNKVYENTKAEKNQIIENEFLTKEIQAELTPEIVLEMLKKRNLDYVEEKLIVRNSSERKRKSVSGQYPAAVVLSCIDSRVPVEDIFHSGIGDLFVARVAGNICCNDILGSLEYACLSGSKIVLVLGHDNCGAIKSAIDNVEVGNITTLLSKIKPAIESASNFEGEKTSKCKDYVDAVTESNIIKTIETIRTNSDIIRNMEAEGKIKIVGGKYHIETGIVEFLNFI